MIDPMDSQHTERAGREHRRAWALAALAVMGVGLAACGGGGSDSKTSNSSNGQAQYGSEEFGLTMDELAQKIDQGEQLIGECMTAAGFEYVPVDFERVKEGMDADKSAPGLNDEEFVKQFGFGISTQADHPGREIGLGEQNILIYDALTPEEKVAYDHTLLGDDREATFAQSIEAEDFSKAGGCTRQAAEQIFTPEELTQAYINPADVAIEQDPRVVTALGDWSTCMRDKGYDYATPDDVEQDLHDRFDAIAKGADPRSLTGSDATALTELQGEELALAPVSTKCEEDVLEPVISDVEAEIFGAPQA
jgi:hypothetical protein